MKENQKEKPISRKSTARTFSKESRRGWKGGEKERGNGPVLAGQEMARRGSGVMGDRVGVDGNGDSSYCPNVKLGGTAGKFPVPVRKSAGAGFFITLLF